MHIRFVSFVESAYFITYNFCPQSCSCDLEQCVHVAHLWRALLFIWFSEQEQVPLNSSALPGFTTKLMLFQTINLFWLLLCTCTCIRANWASARTPQNLKCSSVIVESRIRTDTCLGHLHRFISCVQFCHLLYSFRSPIDDDVIKCETPWAMILQLSLPWVKLHVRTSRTYIAPHKTSGSWPQFPQMFRCGSRLDKIVKIARLITV